MNPQFTPYRCFPGTSAEAMSFYHSIFGRDFESMPFGMLIDKFRTHWYFNVGG